MMEVCLLPAKIKFAKKKDFGIYSPSQVILKF